MRLASTVLILTLAIMASEGKKGLVYDVNQAGQLFENFIAEHKKVYKDEADRKIHYEAFVENLKKINELNAKNPSATYGINKFADYTAEESKSMRGFKKP